MVQFNYRKASLADGIVLSLIRIQFREYPATQCNYCQLECCPRIRRKVERYQDRIHCPQARGRRLYLVTADARRVECTGSQTIRVLSTCLVSADIRPSRS